MPVLATRPMTADEFFRMETPLAGKYELVKGEVVHMPPPGFPHGEIQVNIAFAIKSFLRSKRIGRVVTESGALLEREPDTVRGPDVSFYSQERLPLNRKVRTYHDLPPDLAVEVLSPDDRVRDVNEKISEYLAAGVRVVWLVRPEERNVTVYSVSAEPKTYEVNDTLPGGEVLPGFECLVGDFFE